jgi:lactate dehydrogenase-like 2-hydroxyacid dehydrogenase
VRYLDLPTLLREADHVMIVVPYAAENHHMIGAEEIALMKPTATITNISRGGLIDEAALIAALREGRIAGVGLDVYEGEPNLNPGWLELGNVALAPHIGSASRNTRNAMAALAIDNLKAALSGRRPSCLVNPEAYKS